MDVVALHIGADHAWTYVPVMVVVTLVVFLGAVVVRERLRHWADEDDDRKPNS